MEEEILRLAGFKPSGKNKRKRQIVLCHTSRKVEDYISALRNRYNGENPYLPHYIVTRDGRIINIIPPNTYSKFMEIEEVDKKVIVISFENLGWLRKNPLTSAYVNWIGNIYNEGIYERKWRGHFFWQPYTDEQMKVGGELIKKLCEEFNIPKTMIGHNVKEDGISKYEGVVTKSNYFAQRTDLSPAFEFETIEKIIKDE